MNLLPLLKILFLPLFLATFVASQDALADAAMSSVQPLLPRQDQYRTPLAGREFHTELFGTAVDVPPRDRDNNASIVVGGTVFIPPVADNRFQPIGSVYLKRRWQGTRFRGVLSGVSNDVDITTATGPLELIGHFDNMNDPFPQEEVVDGMNVTGTSIIWGVVNAGAGMGVRIPVRPFQSDNDLRVQLQYQAGWLYNKPTSDTGTGVRLPPDTLVHGPLLKVKYDGLLRNLLELPHEGWAGGLTANWKRRDRWSDANYGGAVFSRERTRDFIRVAGYVVAAGAVPGTSERNRFIARVHGGFAPHGELDRFSAFRIGGGPVQTETDDLERVRYPGALFNEFPVSDYLISSLLYRRELLFFLFLDVGITYAAIDRVVLTEPDVKHRHLHGAAGSIAINSGFLWDSMLTVEYSRDVERLRNGPSKSAVLVMWSKNF